MHKSIRRKSAKIREELGVNIVYHFGKEDNLFSKNFFSIVNTVFVWEGAIILLQSGDYLAVGTFGAGIGAHGFAAKLSNSGRSKWLLENESIINLPFGPALFTVFLTRAILARVILTRVILTRVRRLHWRFLGRRWIIVIHENSLPVAFKVIVLAGFYRPHQYPHHNQAKKYHNGNQKIDYFQCSFSP